MTNGVFPFGDAASLVASLLATYHYAAVSNHRGQCYYQKKMVWKGQLVTCRVGVVGLSHFPDDPYCEIWSGYYDFFEPDSMLFDAVYVNIFDYVKKNHVDVVA